MPDLTRKKAGIVACCCEELAEGTVTRHAARKVLDELRPGETVTICLPLFLAGGEGDRTFARFHPTIAVDGCDLKCAARGTGMYSGKPAASVVVSELVGPLALGDLGTARRLSDAGRQAVEATAQQIASEVDRVLRITSRTAIERAGAESQPEPAAPDVAPVSCSCGSGVPVLHLLVDGTIVEFVALPLVFEQFRSQGRQPGEATDRDLVEAARIYTAVPEGQDAAYARAVTTAYVEYWARESRS